MIATAFFATPSWSWTPTQDRYDGLSAAQLFDLADARRGAGADDDVLVIYDALDADPDPNVRMEALYRRGLFLADLGRYAEAASSFHRLLEERPDIVVARLELARVLAAMGRIHEARRELGLARSRGIPDEAEPLVEQFATALRSRRRLGGSFELAVAPDTNVNRATQARTLDTIIAPLTLSDDARAKSGFGLRSAGQAFVKIPLPMRWSLSPRVAGLTNLYRDDRFSDVSGSALLGVERQGQRTRVGLAVGQTYRWFGGERYAMTNALSADVIVALSPQSQFVVSGSASEARYYSNSLQDGGLYDAAVIYERAPTKWPGLSVSVSATRQDARDPGYATWSIGANVAGWRDTRVGTVFGSIGLRKTEADERLFLFPERREEWLTSARVGINIRTVKVAGFSPLLRVIFENNASSVGLYDYQRLAAEFGLSRAF